MPYIPEANRASLILDNAPPADVGELTYILYHHCVSFWGNRGSNFSNGAQILGALESTKQEFYRRVLAPYEDKKLEENGDV